MKREHLRTILIGILIAWGVEFLIPLTQTVLDFGAGIQFRYPLTHYLLWGYLPVVFSGVYVGLAKPDKKVINGVVVGLFYYAALTFCMGLFRNRLLPGGILSFGYSCLIRGIICAVVSWATNKIKQLVNEKMKT